LALSLLLLRGGSLCCAITKGRPLCCDPQVPYLQHALLPPFLRSLAKASGPGNVHRFVPCLMFPLTSLPFLILDRSDGLYVDFFTPQGPCDLTLSGWVQAPGLHSRLNCLVATLFPVNGRRNSPSPPSPLSRFQVSAPTSGGRVLFTGKSRVSTTPTKRRQTPKKTKTKTANTHHPPRAPPRKN